MADENSNVPPKPSEASKVAPKKETVRISLPPKPTASPTIKLPAMPAGGAGAAKPAPSAAAAPKAAAPAPSASAPAAPKPPSAGAPKSKVAAPTPKKPGSGPRPATPQRPVAAAAQTSMLDKVLAIVAMIVSLLAVGSLYYLFHIIISNPPRG